MKTKAKKLKYKKGDIIGVCSDAMYEFRITSYSEKYKAYLAKCTSSYMPAVKVGQLYQIKPKQIMIKLGDKGKKWPIPTGAING